jgi:hypothetical protein
MSKEIFTSQSETAKWTSLPDVANEEASAKALNEVFVPAPRELQSLKEITNTVVDSIQQHGRFAATERARIAMEALCNKLGRDPERVAACLNQVLRERGDQDHRVDALGICVWLWSNSRQQYLDFY